MIGAGNGNRTRITCLEGRCSTIELYRHMVRVVGFEPTASSVQDWRYTTYVHPDMVATVGLEPTTDRV